jgi:hypothetical protein
MKVSKIRKRFELTVSQSGFEDGLCFKRLWGVRGRVTRRERRNFERKFFPIWLWKGRSGGTTRNRGIFEGDSSSMRPQRGGTWWRNIRRSTRWGQILCRNRWDRRYGGI